MEESFSAGNVPVKCLQGDKRGGSKFLGASEAWVFSGFVGSCCPWEMNTSPEHFSQPQLSVSLARVSFSLRKTVLPSR